ncbi:MAG: hypothetical protein F4Y00_03100 [Bacteroidetes bacterium SB0662_bin_6]|nr:hypothetical protein [Bacteroidetes bacterium SB0668_bin_1]MYE03948.1 hypothetical protein [Bacteroidetes bacterium SB0662_bin_6]
MQRLIMIACLTALAAVSPVFAQENTNEADESMSDPAVCLIGDHGDLPEADAHTSAFLVCRELRDQGIQVGEPVYDAPASAIAYRVTLHVLGQNILVRLSEEAPVGTVVIERELLLAGIEEMVSAAPRLVDALVNETSLATTVDMENLVEEEARELRKIPGEFMWRLGMIGTSVSNNSEFGAEWGWFYETPSYAVGTEFRGSGGSNDNDERFTFFAWSIGGQYFFNKKNISPYVGGGIARSWGSRDYYEEENFDDDYYYSYTETDSESGMGIYVVGGVEALRLSRARLKLELRIDQPFYKVGNRAMTPVSVGASVSLPSFVTRIF